eukprot:5884044-Amphidinium_carterae.1
MSKSVWALYCGDYRSHFPAQHGENCPESWCQQPTMAKASKGRVPPLRQKHTTSSFACCGVAENHHPKKILGFHFSDQLPLPIKTSRD